MNRRTITVSQLNNYIKAVFDAEEMLHGIDIVGEVEGLSIRGSAVYLSIKDEGAVIQCVSYHPTKFAEIKNGDKVILRGRVSFWHKAGKINFTAVHVEKFGLGHLFQKLNELKEKLQSEGLFDEGKKRSLPQDPKRIGVITSKQGAVIHDIINVAHRRNPSVDIVLFPVQVQGTGADKTIADAIGRFTNVDLIIVARGGGSTEDLSAFNSELVARAVFECQIPIISAIGHETDWTLIDFVADLRAPTPSAAAEVCIPIFVDQRQKILQTWNFLNLNILNRLNNISNSVKSDWNTTQSAMISRINQAGDKIESLSVRIEVSNPLAILRRGYAKILGKQGRLKPDDRIRIRIYNGEITARIEEAKYD
ncbi:MAG: exodeoxyribonuclease VII large subunit [Firmicutes bacterium]|nr:exodeoxyribonuclease VII large subunit [Bacillota bacterium]